MHRVWSLLVMVLLCSGLMALEGCQKKEPQTNADAMSGAQGDEDNQQASRSGEEEAGLELTALQRVNFAFDSDMITPEAARVLKGDAGYLKKHPKLKVLVEGHCDERGTNEYNLALGDRRARAVKRYLVDLGVSAGRLKTKSFGEERPLETASNEWAWSQNRRAEFVELR